MSVQRVLIVDDEARFRRALVRTLRGHGYAIRESETGGAALDDFCGFKPHVVLLDLMLPDRDGVSVCRELRRDSETAIIVLSAIGDEQTKVKALDEGADDYLTKPFGVDELLARMRAALRRSVAAATTGVLHLGPLSIDIERRLVHLSGEELHLTPTEFNLLRYLAANAGRVLRHPAILRSVWGEEYADDIQILRTYVNQLRTKLHDDRAHPRFIRSEPGIGYRCLQPDA